MLRTTILFWIFSVFVICQVKAQQVYRIGVDPVVPLGRYSTYIVDSADQLTASEALQVTPQIPIEVTVPNFGLSHSSYWIRTRVRNEEMHVIMHFWVPHAEVEIIDAYLVRNGKPELLINTGQLRRPIAASNTDVDHSSWFKLDQGQEVELLFKIKSDKQLQFPIYVGTSAAISEHRSERDVIIGLYMGIMIVLLLYNFFIFASIKDRSYGYYVGYLLLVTLTQSAFMGIGCHFIWSGSAWFSMHASMIFTALTAVAANEFMFSFLHVKSLLPKTYRIRWFFYCMLALGIAARLTAFPHAGYQMLQMTAGPMALYQLYVALVLTRKGVRAASFFLIAWTVFLIGIVLFIMKDLNILPYNALSKNTMTIGSALEGILLSFGLADKINILRKEKERSQAEALFASQENERIIREQNVVLEERVRARTSELRETNTELERTFNDLKQTQSKLVDAEKMASLGQLTAGIAHEINNPINFITSNIPPLRRDLAELLEIYADQRKKLEASSDEDSQAILRKAQEMDLDTTIAELHEIVDSIEEGADRTTEIVRGLRSFSRLDEDDLKMADVNEGIHATIALLKPQLNDPIKVERNLGDLPAIECFPGKLNQVVMNILNNAAQAVASKFGKDPGGSIVVSTRRSDEHVMISIVDNGCGMSEEVRSKVFEPFFTTKDVGEGTGLGLSISFSIIATHNGTIEVGSVEGEGSEFLITLPIHQPKAMSKAS